MIAWATRYGVSRVESNDSFLDVVRTTAGAANRETTTMDRGQQGNGRMHDRGTTRLPGGPAR
jgi:hypothetical protein